jgi:hypothetical protein
LARTAGCGKLQTTSGSGAGEHLQPGETTTYDTSPPSHGKHDPTPLAAGVYDKPLSLDPGAQPTIYQAVHSLEHGAVIIWYAHLSSSARDDLERRHRDERKVLVVPYPQLARRDRVAITAWGRLIDCERASPKLIGAFIERFREARSAPEPHNPI